MASTSVRPRATDQMSVSTIPSGDYHGFEAVVDVPVHGDLEWRDLRDRRTGRTEPR